MYNNPIPVVVCLAPLHGQKTFFGIRRAIAPKIGELAFPGGYVDANESAEAAASRELKEETFVDIPPSQWKPLCTRVTPDNRLLIFRMSSQHLPGTFEGFVPNSEVSELAALTSETKMAFPLHEEVLKLALNQ